MQHPPGAYPGCGVAASAAAVAAHSTTVPSAAGSSSFHRARSGSDPPRSNSGTHVSPSPGLCACLCVIFFVSTAWYATPIDRCCSHGGSVSLRFDWLCLRWAVVCRPRTIADLQSCGLCVGCRRSGRGARGRSLPPATGSDRWPSTVHSRSRSVELSARSFVTCSMLRCRSLPAASLATSSSCCCSVSLVSCSPKLPPPPLPPHSPSPLRASSSAAAAAAAAAAVARWHLLLLGPIPRPPVPRLRPTAARPLLPPSPSPLVATALCCGPTSRG